MRHLGHSDAGRSSSWKPLFATANLHKLSFTAPPHLMRAFIQLPCTFDAWENFTHFLAVHGLVNGVVMLLPHVGDCSTERPRVLPRTAIFAEGLTKSWFPAIPRSQCCIQ